MYLSFTGKKFHSLHVVIKNTFDLKLLKSLLCIYSINIWRSRCEQAAYGGSFCRVEVNWVHSLSLVDSVKLGEDERPLPLMRLYMFM